MSTQSPAPGPHYETTPPVAPTEDSVGGQPAGRPVGHEGTRVEITERKAWSVGGLPTLLILLLLFGGAIVLAGQAFSTGDGRMMLLAMLLVVLGVLGASSLTIVNPGDTKVVYDVHHPKPWGWRVATYLWTKGIASGALLIAAILLLFGWAGDRNTFDIAAPLLGMIFIAATAVFLITDLKRPERFWFLLAKPNPTSWLVWGGYILGLFGAVAFLWLGAALLDLDGVQNVLMALSIPLAAASAGYTAFLFAQAEGRDSWQSPMLLPHLLVQAGVAGAAILLIGGGLLGADDGDLRVLAGVLAGAVVLSAALLLMEYSVPHVNAHVRKTVDLITHGPYRSTLLGGVLLLGTLVPVALVALMFAIDAYALLGALAGVAALAGLWLYERMWVSAGQDVPLS